MSPHLVQHIEKNGAKFGIKLSSSEVTAVNVASTLRSVFAAVWMHNFFQLTGDPMPNTDGEIHLEKQDIKGIYEEYEADFEEKGRNPLCYQSFCKLWTKSFPHVKIRAYKQVSGQSICECVSV